MNQHDTTLLPQSLDDLVDMADLIGFDLSQIKLTLDSGFDGEWNKQCIRSFDMIPVIKPNRRGTKNEKKIEAMYDAFDETMYKERFKIERTFAWQDTYRKLVIRYEKLEATHNGFKYLAYAVMNLRIFFENSL